MWLMSIWFRVHCLYIDRSHVDIKRMLLMPLQESICCYFPEWDTWLLVPLFYFDSTGCNVRVNKVIVTVLSRSRDSLLAIMLTGSGSQGYYLITYLNMVHGSFATMARICFHYMVLCHMSNFCILFGCYRIYYSHFKDPGLENVWYHVLFVHSCCRGCECIMDSSPDPYGNTVMKSLYFNSELERSL
jgi:hypothetical protein